MRRMVGMVLAAVALTGISPQGVAASPRHETAARRIELGLVNRVHATATGYVPVRIAHRAKISAVVHATDPGGPNADVRVRGGGYFGGVLLEADPLDLPKELESTYLAGTFHRCASPCPGRPGQGVDVVQGVGQGGFTILPAGDYRLYALTADRPLDVTLTLHGLHGHRSLSPTIPVRMDLHHPRPSPLPGAPDRSESWIANYSKSGTFGISIGVYWARIATYAGHAEGDCTYNGAEPPFGVFSYTALCQPYTFVRDVTGSPPVGPYWAQAGGSGIDVYHPNEANAGKPVVLASQFVNFLSRVRHVSYGIWTTSPTPIGDAWSSAFFLGFD